MKFKTSSLTSFLMLPLPLGDSGGWLSLWGSGVEGGALQLLPLPRLMFDLAAYWSVPAATAMLGESHVAQLLHRGAVLLPDAFPASLVAQVMIPLTAC